MRYLKKWQKNLVEDATLSVDIFDVNMNFAVNVEQPDPKFTFIGIDEQADEAEEDEDE